MSFHSTGRFLARRCLKKGTTENGWFAARPSGTENIYKVYAESFRDAAHLRQIQSEAQSLVADILTAQQTKAAASEGED